ncbi:hypothetical protein [Methylobacterium brachythecii]|uniref:Putative Fe-S cluster-containing MiaB family protein n=1 Tax=Methylobacterium brachythecii TaxID=1176177 RepID=A0A7W6ADT4_9HYPH|nr:hypothetical protein [Methylobacterium brachythecii]MBB3900868.1 putative Fe-S cluster-containing MiaB family protein [Methylobacterium brachythecii]GLS46433.1 hypothetical protein GCM10007884_44270 [Methylobacterium brachythecii]
MEVASYVERRRGCNHWEGEDAYDAPRGRDIATAIKTLGCERLHAEERCLRKLYQAKPEIRKAIDDPKNEDG